MIFLLSVFQTKIIILMTCPLYVWQSNLECDVCIIIIYIWIYLHVEDMKNNFKHFAPTCIHFLPIEILMKCEKNYVLGAYFQIWVLK